MITLEELKAIFAQVVKDFPVQDCLGINTFAFQVNDEDIDKANLGKSYDDYKCGSFWSRSWERLGASKDDLKAEAGYLFLNYDEFNVTDINSLSTCDKFYLSVLLKISCDKCKRNFDKTIQDAKRYLLLVLKEALKYRKYTVIFKGETKPQTVWMTEGRKECLKDKFESCSGVCGELEDLITFDFKNKDFFITGSKATRNVIGWSFPFEVCCLETEDLEFNYQCDDPKVTGVVVCPKC